MFGKVGMLWCWTFKLENAACLGTIYRPAFLSTLKYCGHDSNYCEKNSPERPLALWLVDNHRCGGHLIMSGEFLPADRRHLAIPLAIPGLKTGRVPLPRPWPRPHDLNSRLWYTIAHPILIQS